MKKAIIAAIVFSFSTVLSAQVQATPPVTPPAPQEVNVMPFTQVQIDAAWKDLEIAQLKLQLAVQQALSSLGSGVYYDFNQRKFLRQPAVPATKPAFPKEKPAVKP